jgi:3,4-dihydroxy 2-butanone 4-phosphate synthase/GTP cyclohydrolase II
VVGVGEFNEGYLETKRDKMGHALPTDEVLDTKVAEGRTA